ncbi:MAG: UV DNA damage repair endonuclease UvsE [Candidatus Hodarchaeota archaeon]
MKIGYPCINLTLDCRSSRTFRLKSYSEERLIETIKNNLNCLLKILEFNNYNRLLFFRITSDLIPFASHPVMKFNWQEYFKSQFKELGAYIKKNSMRITMHPGQYTVINSKNDIVVQNSLKELEYHVEVLELLGLDSDAKIITHVGGVYGDKKKSIKRFIRRYEELNESTKNHYVIENDEKNYQLKDCLLINESTDIPIVFDSYHHDCYNQGEPLERAVEFVIKTWKKSDGLPIVHYSSEHPDKGKYRHANEIDINHFKSFIIKTSNFNFDLMLEIKNKEKSALVAMKYLIDDIRFNQNLVKFPNNKR